MCMSKFKNQNVRFFFYTIPYITTKQPDFWSLLGLYCFDFTALAIDKTFTQLFAKQEWIIVSIYFPIKTEAQRRPKSRENLKTATFNSKFTVIKKV